MITRRPTILDVARAAGVSTATVSRALNGGLVSRQARRRIETVIDELGYRRNTLARGLVTGRSGVIGVLIPDVMGPLYAQMARGIEEVLEPLGMHFMMVTDNRDVAQERSAIEILSGRRVDALIVIGSQLDASDITALTGPSTPVVMLQRENGDVAEFSTVRLDNRGGAQAALKYLYDCGHRAIAHISGVRRDARERRGAYLDFMANAGLRPWLIEGDSTESAGEHAAGKLLRRRKVTAVFCTNDRTAAGLYRAVKSRGLGIPDDLSVVGFDDLPWVVYLDPPLTTVRQPGLEMGRAAARQVLLREKAPTHDVTVTTRLIKRASVRWWRAQLEGGEGLASDCQKQPRVGTRSAACASALQPDEKEFQGRKHNG